MPELMICAARLFLDAPYVAGTLEREPEGLVVNLRELDCTTFAETTLALARTMRQGGEHRYEDFLDQLRTIRYREGAPDYMARLHYMADWFYENERKGIVRDIGKELGGVPLPLALSFISTHPESYKPLRNNPALVRAMAEREQLISARPHYYLPKEQVARLSAGIRDGDILCFVTTVKGLDVTHVGIAYWMGDTLTFIHASSAAKRVIVQEPSLGDYLARMKRCKGIIVARPL